MGNTHFKRLICIVLFITLLTGCAYRAPDMSSGVQQENGDGEITTLGLSPEFNYEVPESLPNILVDQIGYAENGDKIAVFKGEQLPDQFTIMDADSKEAVYTGEIIHKGYDKEAGESISYGDFTSFKTSGKYYIEAAVIGQSYMFEIMPNPYAGLYDAALKQYYYNRCGMTLSKALAGDAAHSACHTKEAQMKDDASVKLDVSGGWHVDASSNRDVGIGCRTINDLLLAYELYPNVFDDALGIPESGNGIPDLLDEVRYEIDWLMKMQDSRSGAVYSAVGSAERQAADGPLYIDEVTMDATIQFAAALAKFSYLYQGYDREFAAKCQQAADKAYRYAKQNLQDVAPEEYFFASTELYRATGKSGYHAAIKDYLTQNPVSDMENDFIFRGSVTYLNTRQRVDVKTCETLIKILMLEGEQISYASKNSKLLVCMDETQGGSTSLFRDIIRLAVVDHIITNHEYATVLQNHLHYVLGRNDQSICYLDGAGTRSYQEVNEDYGIMKHVELNAQLVLVMSAVMDEFQAAEAE